MVRSNPYAQFLVREGFVFCDSFHTFEVFTAVNYFDQTSIGRDVVSESIIAEYSADYCENLALAYGEGMMSEGGTAIVGQLFAGIELRNKRCLDIGFGLGGLAFHLAEHYQADVTGVEINPRLVEEATQKIPPALQSRLQFLSYDGSLALADHSFDVVYSKGVLVHVQDKRELLAEIRRVLRVDGCLVIDDWLSTQADHWGPLMQRLCEVDDLSLFPQTQQAYMTLLHNAGFNYVDMQDESEYYLQCNREIIERLQRPEIKDKFIQRFGDDAWQDAVEGYQCIIDAIGTDELQVQRIVAH